MESYGSVNVSGLSLPIDGNLLLVFCFLFFLILGWENPSEAWFKLKSVSIVSYFGVLGGRLIYTS